MREDGELLFAYAREGDVKALSELVVRHGVWMRAFLRSLLPGEADADDAFQDACRSRLQRCRTYTQTVLHNQQTLLRKNKKFRKQRQ